MKKLFMIGLMCAACLSLTTIARADTFSFNPTADGYGNAFAADTSLFDLFAGKAASAYTAYRVAMKFDLTAIPDNYVVTGAILSLNGPYGSLAYGTPTFDLVHSSFDNWTQENNVDNNLIKSVVTQNPLGTALISGKTDYAGLSNWNLFANSNWNYAQDLTDNQLTLIIKEAGEITDFQGFSWYSSEYPFNPALRPKLTVTAHVAPEPLSSILFVVGGSALAAFRRKRVPVR